MTKSYMYKGLIQAQQDTYIQDLIKLLKFSSISGSKTHEKDIQACALYLRNYLEDIGLEQCRLYKTAGNPIVYGEWCHAKDRPTILIYGHYDTQPIDPIDAWDNLPFDPIVKNNQIIARGSSDNKGQFFCHLMAIKLALDLNQKLSVNVKVIIEGEEEIGSPNLAPFIESHKDLLSADIALVSDTPMFAKDNPSLCISLRGITYLEICLRTGHTDLHSGQHGGVAPNAITELCKLLAQLKDDHDNLLIPGFYDDVISLDPEIKTMIDHLPFDEAVYTNNQGLYGIVGDKNFSPYERLWFRPTLDIHGISGGFTQAGSKTVIPCTARAKISTRLVPNQSSQICLKKIKNYLNDLTPSHAKLEITTYQSCEPVMTNFKTSFIKTALNALHQAFDKKPILQGEGGSIPIVSGFKSLLNIDTLLMGLNLPEDKIHAPNEQFSIDNLLKGIEASIIFLEHV